MQRFKAFRIHTESERSEGQFEDISLNELDEGAVVIKTAYSGINYKDAMAAFGVGKNVRTERPCVSGIARSE